MNRKTYERRAEARRQETLKSCRQPERYYVLADVTVKKHLKPRTLAIVYAENKAGRHINWSSGPRNDVEGLTAEYLDWCKERRHKPHPASLDWDHEINKARVRREQAS